jgi:putative flavoprotein involved in K+ transport
MSHKTQVVVIGGGQTGLAAGYHLRRLGVEFVILDAQTTPDGAWQHAWDSLHLFSPAACSSLPAASCRRRPARLTPTPARSGVPDRIREAVRTPRRA